jgi:hydrogenase-4 component B
MTFLVGSVAICGLPPLNGFLSEWLVYLGAFRASADLPVGWNVPTLAVLPALALIGGLASACFVKVFGIVFLGQPRTQVAFDSRAEHPLMRASMIAGALLCATIGLCPASAVALVSAPAAAWMGLPAVPMDVGATAAAVGNTAWVVILVSAAIAAVRWMLLRGRTVTEQATWGCGYSAPTSRMQYTATSFAAPVLSPFAMVFSVRTHREGPEGFFPREAHYEEHAGDVAAERVWTPATRSFVRLLSFVRVLQRGRIHLYLMYILIALVALLAWQFARPNGS